MKSLFRRMLDTIKGLTGNRVDYDKAYGYQCVDLVRSYADRIGEKIGTFSGSALNGWNSGSPFVNTRWVRQTYKPGMIAPSGSIVFFDKSRGNPYGHVAVVSVGSNANTISILEQNASGSGNGIGIDAPTVRSIGYNTRGKCLGWYYLP